MVCITVELIRKKAEHHSASLFDLEELSLAQQHLDRIDLLGRVCPHLKILTLQGNSISKLENLSRLKDLKYLNVAMNRISRCENLQGCESLARLDLTLNSVGIAELSTLATLRANLHLRRMYLLGNPCSAWPEHRAFVVATLPQLEHLDGTDILRSERMSAKRQLAKLGEYIQLHQDGTHPSAPPDKNEIDDPVVAANAIHTGVEEHSRSLTISTEAARPQANDDGKPRQRNQGKWPFKLEEAGNTIVLTLVIGKFMRMEDIEIDVQTSYVCISVKSQAFCLHLPVEVNTTSAQANHSAITGVLTIYMHTTRGMVMQNDSKQLGKDNARRTSRCTTTAPRCAISANQADVYAHEHIPDVIQ